MVAALGDSITAGVGARANSVLDIFTEYRGVVFSIGGQVRPTAAGQPAVV